jgi:hypothetical protein
VTLTVAELDMLLHHVAAVGDKVDALAIKLAAHCAAEEALLKRAPLLAAIGACVSAAAAVCVLLGR